MQGPFNPNNREQYKNKIATQQSLEQDKNKNLFT